MKYFYLYIPLILLFFLNNNYNKDRDTQKNDTIKQVGDSISVWITRAKNKNIGFKKRKEYLDKAYEQSLEEANDTLQNTNFLKLAFAYSKLEDSLSFRKVNKLSINLSRKIKDSASLADNYWDLGNFYSKNGIKDSAYFTYSRAQKIYEEIGNSHYSGRMFLNMAIIQSDIKDYTSSEISTIKALSLLKPLKKDKQLYRCYNNLGIIFDELEEYDKALFYHKKAFEYQQKIKSKNCYKENTLNNIGVSNEKQKNYKEAIKNYQLALKEENLQVDDIKLYAMLYDNMAYSKFKLQDTLGVKKLFYKSLKIRDSINDYLGIAVNKLHLAEYYAFNKDTTKAVQLATEAKELTATTKNYRDQLASLLILSKLDKKNSDVYTNQYIKLNDSLQKQERAIRNKFARIRFETDEFIDKNKRLNKQRILILSISGVALLVGFLLFIIKYQRVKNKELRFGQQQQQINEEIYNLMLTQQNKLDEGRRKEKKRISEELHDGILGKLFGTRLLLSTMNENTDKKSILEREKYINDLQLLEEELRNVSHELNNKSLISDVSYAHMIESLLENQGKITKVNYKFTFDKNIIWEEIDGSLKMNLYRIIQEALQNSNKYAKAKNVIIEFKIDTNYLSLLIEDDGIGFDTETKNKGIGLKNMKSRVDTLKGKLSINSHPKKGTLIIVKIPYINAISTH